MFAVGLSSELILTTVCSTVHGQHNVPNGYWMAFPPLSSSKEEAVRQSLLEVVLSNAASRFLRKTPFERQVLFTHYHWSSHSHVPAQIDPIWSSSYCHLEGKGTNMPVNASLWQWSWSPATLITNPPSSLSCRNKASVSSILTNEDEPGFGEGGPFKHCVEHILSLAVQLIHLIQHNQTADEKVVGIWTSILLRDREKV